VTGRRRLGTVLGTATLAVLITPSQASAALAISVPATINLGSVPSGTSSISNHLGTVTVTASALLLPSYVAQVSSTVFTTGAGGAGRTIGTSSISYWSGPATAALLQNATPGQVGAANAQDLSVTRTAFAAAGLALSITTKWDPTIVVTFPAGVVAGAYSGTITHSVA
jgi:hypothetical protein